MDIRKFFTPLNQSKKVEEKESKKKRKKHVIADSDSDEEPIPKSHKKSKLVIEDSDDDIFVIEPKKKKEIQKPATKRVMKQSPKQLPKTSAKDFFGSMMVQRSDRTTDKGDRKKKLVQDERDKNFEKTLDQLDNADEARPAKKLKMESSKTETPSKKLSNLADIKNNKKEKLERNGGEGPSPKKLQEKAHQTERHKDCDSKRKKKLENNSKENIDHTKRGRKKEEKGSNGISKIEIVKEQKTKKETTPVKLDDSIIPATPEEKAVNKRSLSYKNFLQRAGPRNPGSKSIPEGTPNCLAGLTFVLTGVLESFDREEIGQAIKERGGRLTTSVSKKTSYLIVGDEPGESKTKKAEQLGIKLMSEDELLDLMRTQALKSGNDHVDDRKKTKTPKKGAAESTVKDKRPKSSPIKKEPNPLPDKIEKVVVSDHERRKLFKEEKMSPVRSSQSSTTSSLSQTSIPSTSNSPIGGKSMSKSVPGEDLWVDKYKPTSLKNIIGQQGEASNAKKLLNWLRSWQRNQYGKVKLVKPGPWAKDNTGAYFKAALLSGPPGVGKTTTVNLVCKDVGFDTVEFNASDTRSKRSMKEEITELLSNMSLVGLQKGEKVSRERVLVMDEVDGMAGNEDRGGMQELIALIKGTKVPIICMCNDRNSQKIRSLANYCFDLRYNKPRVEQIRGAMMSVCFKEGIKIKPDSLDEIIIGSNQDVRQVLNHLSVWSADNKELGIDQTKKDAKMSKKEFKIGPWDVCTKTFNESAHKTMSIHDKIGLFFNDYSLGPLFIQQNYPKVSPSCARGNPKKLLDQLAKTAQSICDGDLVEKTIRSTNAWSLLPTQALFHSVLPGQYMAGHMAAQVEFPRWLGNFSRQKKFDRLSQELHTHMILRISGSKRDVLFDYAQHLRNAVVKPLLTKGQDGVLDAVEVMNSHDLIREDLDSLLELSSWPHSQDHMAKVDSKIKSAFTRTLNKSSHLNPYGAGNICKKRGKTSDSMDSDEESDYEENDDIGADAMISVSKKTAKAPSKPSTSRGKGKGKK